MITWTDVTNHVSSLATTPVEVQADILAFVELQVNIKRCGGINSPKLKLARIYLAAHYASLTGQSGSGAGGATGQVKSLKEGDLTVTFADSKGTSTSSTMFGKLYEDLIYCCAGKLPIIV